MKNATKLSFILLPAVVLALVLTGCAKVPQAEIDAAKAAVEAAKTADAQTYAVTSYNAAMDAYTAMDNELKIQEQAGKMKKKFDKVLTLATEAKSLGEKAATEAAAGKETTKAEAAQAIPAVEAALPAAKEMIEKAAKVKGVKLDSKALLAQLETAKGVLKEAQKDLEAGNYMDAKNKVTAVQEQLADGEKLVKDAVDAVTKPKK